MLIFLVAGCFECAEGAVVGIQNFMEFRVLLLYKFIEIHQISGIIVQNRLHRAQIKIQSRSACEGFNIAVIIGNHCDKLTDLGAFASRPFDQSFIQVPVLSCLCEAPVMKWPAFSA